MAFEPRFFSWTAVTMCIVGLYVFGTLGVNLGFHRLLSHRSFACPRWLEHVLAILGVCCLQEGPSRWVAIHRKHHQHADDPIDPHSPLVTLVWGHVGWLVTENRESDSLDLYDTHARDLLEQAFYRRVERRYTWLWIYAAHALLFAVAGTAIGWLVEATPADAMRFAASIVVWGVFVRTALVWHITWSVNSLGHLWGYRTHATPENSRNNWLVALLSNGEGWHNNHHAQPRSAAHGHRWWELDVSYLTILALEAVGLAWDVTRPSPRRAS